MLRYLRLFGLGLRLSFAHTFRHPVPWVAVVLVGVLQVLLVGVGARVINWALIGRPLLPASFPLVEIVLMLTVSIVFTAMRTYMQDPEEEYPRQAATATAWFVLVVSLAGWSWRVQPLGMARTAAITAWLMLVLAGGAALIAWLRHPARTSARRRPLEAVHDGAPR